MNIRWDGTNREFVAEFSPDFQGDLEAVKLAGFRTSGPPEWRWYAPSPGVKALNRLRENRPASGLTISPEAREQYTPLAEMEAKNAEVKAQLAEHTKALKKKLKVANQDAKAASGPQMKMCEEGYLCLSKEDLPVNPVFQKQYAPPSPPAILCIICSFPVYFYEKQDPPTCLFCEKEVLDFSQEVC